MNVKKDRSAKKPDLEKAKQVFGVFLETVASLRHPDTGCPWDNEQTHASLTKYMIEEAYEASDAMQRLSSYGEADIKDEQKSETLQYEIKNLAEELGDVLLQVVLNAQLGLDGGAFSVVDVIENIDAKMKRRHPHVFGTDEEKSQRDKNDIKKKWQDIKALEKGGSNPSSLGVFERGKVAKVRPASLQANKIGEIARTIDFDWETLSEVFDQLDAELAELKEAVKRASLNELSSKELSFKESSRLSENPEVQDELGDVFFTLAQLSRHIGLNPEMAAQRGNDKFLKRFRELENIAENKNQDVSTLGAKGLGELWLEAKNVSK